MSHYEDDSTPALSRIRLADPRVLLPGGLGRAGDTDEDLYQPCRSFLSASPGAVVYPSDVPGRPRPPGVRARLGFVESDHRAGDGPGDEGSAGSGGVTTRSKIVNRVLSDLAVSPLLTPRMADLTPLSARRRRSVGVGPVEADLARRFTIVAGGGSTGSVRVRSTRPVSSRARHSGPWSIGWSLRCGVRSGSTTRSVSVGGS